MGHKSEYSREEKAAVVKLVTGGGRTRPAAYSRLKCRAPSGASPIRLRRSQRRD